MYQSPFKLFFPKLEEEICNIAKKQDQMVFDAVAKVGVTVDKEELIRALKYDRDQYNRGFNDGIMAAADELVRCKDCVNYCGFDHCKNGICDVDSVSKRAVYPDDFCSYGERRSDD
jgi:hypothetical protein